MRHLLMCDDPIMEAEYGEIVADNLRLENFTMKTLATTDITVLEGVYKGSNEDAIDTILESAIGNAWKRFIEFLKKLFTRIGQFFMKITGLGDRSKKKAKDAVQTIEKELDTVNKSVDDILEKSGKKVTGKKSVSDRAEMIKSANKAFEGIEVEIRDINWEQVTWYCKEVMQNKNSFASTNAPGSKLRTDNFLSLKDKSGTSYSTYIRSAVQKNEPIKEDKLLELENLLVVQCSKINTVASTQDKMNQHYMAGVAGNFAGNLTMGKIKIVEDDYIKSVTNYLIPGEKKKVSGVRLFDEAIAIEKYIGKSGSNVKKINFSDYIDKIKVHAEEFKTTEKECMENLNSMKEMLEKRMSADNVTDYEKKSIDNIIKTGLPQYSSFISKYAVATVTISKMGIDLLNQSLDYAVKTVKAIGDAVVPEHIVEGARKSIEERAAEASTKDQQMMIREASKTANAVRNAIEKGSGNFMLSAKDKINWSVISGGFGIGLYLKDFGDELTMTEVTKEFIRRSEEKNDPKIKSRRLKELNGRWDTLHKLIAQCKANPKPGNPSAAGTQHIITESEKLKKIVTSDIDLLTNS